METKIEQKLAATLAKLDAELAAIDAKLATELAAIDAEIAAVDAALAAELAQIDAEYTEQITAETAPVATQLTLDDVIATLNADVALRLGVLGELEYARGLNTRDLAYQIKVKIGSNNEKIVRAQEAAQAGTGFALVEKQRAWLAGLPMPEGFDEAAMEYMAVGRVSSGNERFDLARTITRVANSVDGVEASAWKSPDGKVVRVYVTLPRSHNGGRGTIGIKTYMTIDDDRCNMIKRGDMSECASMTFARRDFSGSATWKALWEKEIPALDDAFTQANLAIVCEE